MDFGKRRNESLRSEFEEATDFIIELEEKLYKANKTAVQLMKQFRESETEILR